MKWDEALNRYFNQSAEGDQLLVDDNTTNTPTEASQDVKRKTMNRASTLGTDPNNNQNRISHGTKIVGDITSTGSFRIDGDFEGTIQSSGKVVIGESGVVKGTLTSAEVEIEGKIKGKLVVSELLSLRATARVDGEVSTSKLAVEPGATFNATCDMNSNANRAIKTLDGREKAEKPA
ncbi:hypothetical protein LCGC14_3136070 [marine sediment metagenome]|uniref:Cell shape determination protein CcmA n=1 Tax=marine sediment metagenome TaxID=412755 RepID=A0A0F8VY91_9ZZZZ